MKKTKNIMKKILILFILMCFTSNPIANAQTLKYLFKTKLVCINNGILPIKIYFAFDKNYILSNWDMINEEFKLKEKVTSYKKDKIESKTLFINRINGNGYKDIYGYVSEFIKCKTTTKFPVREVKTKF